MCAGAMVLARIKTLVYGTADPKAGAAGSVMNIVKHDRLNHKIKILRAVKKKECVHIIKSFLRICENQKGFAVNLP
jgi:tRNA(adenine34) deaminase